MNKKSFLLKASLFATGFSGIVAEYMLASLATYFLGDSVVQWTMILSVMLFAMGLGSRISKSINKNLLFKFIIAEFALSLLVSFSVLLAYSIAAYTLYEGFLIYGFALGIGFLIGLEIPLVTRINEDNEDLRINISSVLENDYYGSLLGGIFFAFIAIQFIGLTYTPFVLGSINFIVALILLFAVDNNKEGFSKTKGIIWALPVALLMLTGVVFAQDIVQFGDQKKYLDKVVFSKQTRYQKLTVTQWKKDYWLYINGNQQLSTIDEFMYHEPMVHTSVALSNKKNLRVLILGGGDGCAARELLKYDDINSIQLVDLDPEMTNLASTNSIFIKLNEGALSNKKVHVKNDDAFTYLSNSTDFYDIIIVDLPDPKTVELGRLYTKEFYRLAFLHLNKNGVFITQAGSPYFAAKAFYCIDKSLQAAGFNTLPLHNQVMTLGEWGWVLGHKELPSKNMKEKLLNTDFSNIETKWLNSESISEITSFGKPLSDTSNTQVNSIHNPVLYRYYLNGNWDIY